jgi:hypothetical protein
MLPSCLRAGRAPAVVACERQFAASRQSRPHSLNIRTRGLQTNDNPTESRTWVLTPSADRRVPPFTVAPTGSYAFGASPPCGSPESSGSKTPIVLFFRTLSQAKCRPFMAT